jgi:hypothetical protein
MSEQIVEGATADPNADTDLRYRRNRQLRAGIAYVVGADPTRFDSDRRRSLRKATVVAAGEQLRPADSDVNLEALGLAELYKQVCVWAGGEYSPNAGDPWGLNRPNLKRLYTALEARPPREVPGV